MAYTNIDDPSAHFQVNAYTGGGASQQVTYGGNSDLQPDLVITKSRDISRDPTVVDSSRGLGRVLYTGIYSSTQGEDVGTVFSSFDTDGVTFSAGVNSSWFNQSGYNYTSWAWKANGGTEVSNTNGTITTTVQANTDAGFSIVRYTGNGSTGQTIGHGLGSPPELMFFKRTAGAYAWGVYNKFGGTPPEDYNAPIGSATAWSLATDMYGSSAASNTVIGVKNFNEINANGASYVAYAFRSIQGYSKVGKYKGNSSTNGPFIYTGFKPAFIWIFPLTINELRVAHDEVSPGYNPRNYYVTSEAGSELPYTQTDFFSNGFKLYTTNGNWNSSSHTYSYLALAKHPFVSSTGIPTTGV